MAGLHPSGKTAIARHQTLIRSPNLDTLKRALLAAMRGPVGDTLDQTLPPEDWAWRNGPPH